MSTIRAAILFVVILGRPFLYVLVKEFTYLGLQTDKALKRKAEQYTKYEKKKEKNKEDLLLT